jgi:ABC-2 type transport system permease protein
MRATLIATGAICRNTIAVWLRNRSLIAASLVPPIAFLAAGFFAAAAVSHSPIALVNLDSGADGRQMVAILHESDLFRITDANPHHAQALIHNVQVAAIITIPADFTARVQSRQHVSINYEINNFNLDFTNDIRRSVPTAITEFYASNPVSSPIKVRMAEQDLRHKDIQLFQYEVVPILILMILITGLVNTAVSTAREYEQGTVKGILLSPVSDIAIVAGKIFAGFFIGLGCGLVELGICLLLHWAIIPHGGYWIIALGSIALTALFAASAGFALGVWMKKIQAAHALATNAALPMFFLAGGVGVLAFEPHWLQTVAAFIPLTYANHSLQMAMFFDSADAVGRDATVLLATALLTMALAVLAFRQSRSSFK